jgi:uncharacterized protein YggE
VKHIIAALALLLATTGFAAAETQRIITTTGVGSAESIPDMAVVTLGVTHQAPQAADAMAATSAGIAAILQRLGDTGVEERDVQTGTVALQPLWTNRAGQDPSEPQITGYVARNSVVVRVRDLAVLGDLLDALVADGANTFDGLHFALQDPKPTMAAARADAVRDAMSRAEQLAEAAGVVLGPVQSISEGGASFAPRMEMAAARMSDAAGVPVAAGELSTSAQVTMVFTIAD